MERRLSSRLACEADRRETRLLSRLSARAAGRHRALPRLRLCLSGRGFRASRRQAARRDERRACRRRRSSTSCKTTTRSATAPFGDRLEALAKPDGDRSRARDHAARARNSDAVHGRGMGLKSPLPVLLRFQGRPCAKPSERAAATNMPGHMQKFGGDVPDPLSEATFRSAMLDWERQTTAGRERLTLVRELLASAGATSCRALRVRVSARRARPTMECCNANWRLGDDARLSLTANLSDRAIPAHRARPGARQSGASRATP